MAPRQARRSTSGVSDHGKRAFFIIPALALITTLAPINSLFSWLDLKSTDFLFAIKPLIKTESYNHPAVVITKDQTFFERFGRDPNRGDFARLLNLLQESGTQVAALDFIYDQPGEPEADLNFIAALGSFSYPIAAHHFLSRGKQTFEIASLVDQNATRPPWPLPVLKKNRSGNCTQRPDQYHSRKTHKDGSFTLENLPSGIFSITLISRQPRGWIKATASGRLEPGQHLQLPPLDLIAPECNLFIDTATSLEQTQICVFGEAIYLEKTDGESRLSFNLPDGIIAAPLNQNIESVGITDGQLIASQNKPIAHEMVAILSDDDFWGQNFFFRFSPDEKIQLPSSINCQIAVFSKSATRGQQKTLDITVFPGEANIVKELPEATYLDSHDKQINLSNPALSSVLLISETENWLNVPVNQTTTIPVGRYRIFAENHGKKGRFNSLKARLKDRAVFIGTALQEDQNLISTPINFFDPSFPVIPGVHLHANLFSGLVRGDFLDSVFFHSDRAPTTWHLWQAMIMLPLLFACNLIFFHRGAYWGGLSILASSAIWITLAILFFRQGILLPIFYPLLNFSSFGVLRGYYAWEIARRKENETRSTFGRFISAAVVEEIMKTPDSLKPGGEKKELTIMFTDLAGFTTISEKLAPEKLTDLMNEYLGEMTSLLFKYGGTLDKYIGDAIMAFWNHPRAIADHPQQAALCAIAMQQKLAELREKWLKQGLPEVQVRAGINTATCMVGFIGSDVQMNFTCLGDGVNLASRLEGANKNYGTLNMIAESVHAKLDSQVFSTRFLDYLTVKGKEQPIKVYEVRCLRKDETDAWISADSLYHQGIDFYINREWDQAISSFNQVLNIVPEDEPSKIFAERCQKFKIEPPPEKWDGRYILKTK